ncbi:helix-turn-helix transcriptional regulator [uncultured Ruegeria sp.]|uniref:helix-turn-helix domain-containing protein n=1 Tax=uncultured Ruegeria sp. TaxID=259304 RepID=UPI00261425DF|nr:helix-turn-helix transcriptional regulator [uncultured Ruegeria sp.]
MTDIHRSPTDLRRMFGANLRQLAQSYPSVSEMCRQLGINRTQFNRYLGGESFPRPDVLDRICRFFDVDARILLKPLDEVEPPAPHPATDVIDRFLSAYAGTAFRTGFYHAIERAQTSAGSTLHRLYHVRRISNCTLLRGYESVSAMPKECGPSREVQGIVSYAEGRVCALLARRDAQERRMMVLSEQPDENGLRFVGHVFQLADGSALAPKPCRFELRHLGDDLPTAIRLARKTRRAAHPHRDAPI